VSLSSGSRLGPYEIVSPIGAGGMGEVYRAKDPRLGREVAVKVLPASFSRDTDRIRRFEQEAKAAGLLNHPNITAVYDIGTVEGSLYVVTELLEGETLRSRLAGGALVVRRALDYARQIAAGLAAAHEKGIVHRDLKPENLFVTKDGRVKILDFGLAKLTQPEEAGPQTNLPTATGTEPGVVLGTLGYMSPEQVRGRPADARSDIFSFGAILYELLSGRRAFQGETTADTMSAILREEPPDLSATNRNVSPGLERIMRHCLEKNPEERFHSAHDLAFDLEALSGVSAPPTAVALRPRRLSVSLLLMSAGLLVAGLVVGIAAARFLSRPRATEPPRLRYLTYSGKDDSPTVSPDGRTIAFTSSRDGQPRIWLKQIAGGTETALTDGVDVLPRFSPDGETILFTRILDRALLRRREGGGEDVTTSLYRVSALGGEPRKIIDGVWVSDWSPDGRRIVFVDSERRSLRIASAEGGDAREVARIRDRFLDYPRWSPDGRRIAALLVGSRLPGEILLVDLDSGTNRRIKIGGDGQPLGLAWSGVGKEVVFSQADAQTATYRSAPGRIVACDVSSERHRVVLWSPGIADGLDITASGTIVFSANSSRQNLRELPVRAAAREGRWLTRGQSTDRQPVYSPDGETVLFSSDRSGNNDLWAVSTKTGSLRRLTEHPAEDWDPGFTPDGKKIIWSSNRGGHFEIWMADSDGSGARQVSRDGFDAENPTSGGDGGWIIYNSFGAPKVGVWKIRPDGSEAKILISGQTSFPQVSPDGRYVAARVQISGKGFLLRVVRVSDGASVFEVPLGLAGPGIGRPRWMPKGDALAFVALDPDRKTFVIDVQEFRPGEDTTRSRRSFGAFDSDAPAESFAISPDGSRITISFGEQFTALMLAEGIPKIEPPRRRPNNQRK
jgi:serine/threonine protein kinase/sugar lactone lactonase YvrE